MAILIPSVISPEVKSAAERKIFDWFRSAPNTDDWIVLHSLGIATHNKVIYGETDFLVLAPGLGIFAIEVKGGRVKRENGVWYFTNRYGDTNSKSRGPFEQANDGIFSIMKSIKTRMDQRHHNVADIIFGHGVMFPDIEYDAAGIDEEQWQIFDSRNGHDVRTFIMNLSAGVTGRLESVYGEVRKYKYPSKEDIKYLVSLLRGDFDCAVSLGTKLKNAKEALVALTKEQYRCLDQLDDNPRCLIYGPAGTGKTLIAIEEVKKAVTRGQKVALFCFNTNLADWLASYFSNMPEELQPEYVGTLHGYMLSVLKKNDHAIAYPKDASEAREYYQNELPRAVNIILENSSSRFDKIIVDEAQDLISDKYLTVIDNSLRKGIDRGQWTIFGDFSMQAIYTGGITGTKLIEKLEEYASFIRFKLTINCRNTKQICKEIETVTGLETNNELWLKVDGPPVQYITWSTMEEQRDRLECLLQQLNDAHIDPETITILSPRKRENSVVNLIRQHKVIDLKIPQGMHTSFCTIQGYKGLENNVIILTDIEEFSSDKLMYIGLSRACSGLYIFESKQAEKEYNDLLMRRLLNE